MAAPALINLWNNYLAQAKPCNGAWDNQCAIRLNGTLNKPSKAIKIPIPIQVTNRCKCGFGNCEAMMSRPIWFFLVALLPALLLPAKAEPVVSAKLAKAQLRFEQQANSCSIKSQTS